MEGNARWVFPNIRDRVVQTAVKLLLEPLFEADFAPDSYGFRPKRAAHDALEAICEALERGMYWVIDADVTAYFDTIPHDRLMKTVAESIGDIRGVCPPSSAKKVLYVVAPQRPER